MKSERSQAKTERHGFLCLDKPAGMTSHDVVAIARRALKQKQIGHSGTLDPMATGVMILAVGKATRLLRFLKDDKTYEAGVLLGLVTATDDIEGEVLEKKPLTAKQKEQIKENIGPALLKFQGKIEQMPPLYSAIHINGRRLYDLARSGEIKHEELETYVKKRQVTIYDIKLNRLDISNDESEEADSRLSLKIHCSSGTYIRSIARDLGEHFGCGACLDQLRRTTAGAFSESDCHSLDELKERGETMPLLPIDRVGLPILVIEDPDWRRRFCQGQKISPPQSFQKDSQYFLLIAPEQEVLGIAALTEDGLLKPEVVLA